MISSGNHHFLVRVTPLKTNMEPQDWWFGSMFLLFQGTIFRFQPLVLVRVKVSSPAFQKNPPITHFLQKVALTPRICTVSKVGSSDVYNRAKYIYIYVY